MKLSHVSASPRIRAAPTQLKTISSLTLDECKKLEDWEHAESINFSYQELAHEFQVDQFISALNRAKGAKIVRLENNLMKSLNSVLGLYRGCTCPFFPVAAN